LEGELHGGVGVGGLLCSDWGLRKSKKR
jgi:hypothetical protein